MEINKNMIDAVLGAVSELKESDLMKNLSDTAEEVDGPHDSTQPKDIDVHKDIDSAEG